MLLAIPATRRSLVAPLEQRGESSEVPRRAASFTTAPILWLLCLVGAGGCAPSGAEEPDAGRVESEWAGAASCEPCHAAIYAAWAASPHGRHDTFRTEPPRGADAAVGSVWMQAYLEKGANGLHTVQPQAYDLRDEIWRETSDVMAEISGDVDSPDTFGVGGLVFELRCAGCHSSQPSLTIEPVTGRFESSWVDGSINCETCHGPGREHVESWRRLEQPVAMLRLEKLDPRTATAACARCHGSPRPIGDYRPADAANHIALLDDKTGVLPDGRLAGQYYQSRGFVASRCFLEGGLTCAGCHDSHGPGLASPERRDGFCHGCHADKASRAHTHHKPEREGSSCVECHMPRLLTGLMAHQREHRITNPMPWLAEPDACTTAACHGDKGKGWAIEATERWWGPPPTKRLDEIRALSRARRSPQAARSGLEKALESRDPFIRGNAAVYLHAAAAVIDDPVAEVRYLAARGGAPPGEAGVEVLQRYMQDPEPLVRAVAAIRLAERDQPWQRERQEDFEHFIRNYPNAIPVRAQLAEWQNEQGEHGEALANLTVAIAHAPYEGSYWGELATALRGLGRHHDASAASVRWAELEVRTLVRAGRKAEARSLLQQALADAPPGEARTELEGYLELLR